jgi:hypothetical protein
VSYEAGCPACGAPVVFGLGSSLLRVCDHCGVLVARKGADVASYGKVAELVATASVLELGISGSYAGAPRFELVGRLQLDYGEGTWDEWLMAFRNGSWAWLSEAQGRYHYLAESPLPPVPAFDDVAVGAVVDLGPPGTFVVAEKRSARFVTARGELPFDVAPGTALNYVDLSGPGGGFATLDYGTSQQAEALYVGREVTLPELGITKLKEKAPRRAAGASLSCPKCGGPLELRAPDETQRVACPWCGSLLDATRDFAVLEALDRVRVKPLIPLGAKGRFDGVEWTVIGFMERSVTVERVRYPWHEYLLHQPGKGFRWLTHGNGHWSFVEPVNPGDVRRYSSSAQRYRDTEFQHFQSGKATVDHVLGEFYWAVARGDEANTNDYVAPPLMLSEEESGAEVTWSLGTYETTEEVRAAFSLQRALPEPRGVGPNQPWPLAAQARFITSAALLGIGLLLLLYIVALFGRSRVVFTKDLAIPTSLAPGAPETAVFSEPFEIPVSGNVQVKLDAPVANNWVYVEGALINETTGDVDDFDAEVAYYSGTDEDGSWSEGSQSARTYVASVPAGRYVLRLQPQWEKGNVPSRYGITLRSRVPRLYQAVLAVLALAAWPLLVAWRRMRFESERWSESDHPWGGSGGDDDDDGGDDE